jgi:hypothetical protein
MLLAAVLVLYVTPWPALVSCDSDDEVIFRTRCFHVPPPLPDPLFDLTLACRLVAAADALLDMINLDCFFLSSRYGSYQFASPLPPSSSLRGIENEWGRWNRLAMRKASCFEKLSGISQEMAMARCYPQSTEQTKKRRTARNARMCAGNNYHEARQSASHSSLKFSAITRLSSLYYETLQCRNVPSVLIQILDHRGLSCTSCGHVKLVAEAAL